LERSLHDAAWSETVLIECRVATAPLFAVKTIAAATGLVDRLSSAAKRR
jgi:hypothetical protein